MERKFLPKWLTDKAVAKFGSHAKASEAMGLPIRTYADWRLRGFKFDKAHETAFTRLFNALNGTTQPND